MRRRMAAAGMTVGKVGDALLWSVFGYATKP